VSNKNLRIFNSTFLNKNNVQFLKSTVQKRVFTFNSLHTIPERNSEFSKSNNSLGGGLPGFDKMDQIFQPNKGITKNQSNREPASATSNKSSEQVDVTAIFLKKLTEFFACHEILFVMNLDPLVFSLSESLNENSNVKEELVKVSLPPGQIIVSLNNEHQNVNLVSVYGFKLETSSKMQAMYFLYKRIKQSILAGPAESLANNIKFFEIGKAKGKLNQEQRSFKKKYSLKMAHDVVTSVKPEVTQTSKFSLFKR